MTTSLTWRFTIEACDHARVPMRVDTVMSEMLSREDAHIHDTAISVDLDPMTLDISVTVEDLATADAVRCAMRVVQDAMYAAERQDATGSLSFSHAEVVAV